MALLHLHSSLFAITNPLTLLDRWLHPAKFVQNVRYRGKNLTVKWSQRADKALQKRTTNLFVEMQLYFSCVVKKRVLFHETFGNETVTVNDKLQLSFRAVQASSCDPDEFANNYPVKQQFTSTAAQHMRPSCLTIDYVNGQWQGEFSV